MLRMIRRRLRRATPQPPLLPMYATMLAAPVDHYRYVAPDLAAPRRTPQPPRDLLLRLAEPRRRDERV